VWEREKEILNKYLFTEQTPLSRGTLGLLILRKVVQIHHSWRLGLDPAVPPTCILHRLV